jgi:hypothetical protein
MKKFLLTMLLCTAATLNALAQWPTGDNNLSPIDQGKNLEYYDPTMIRKPDGSTLVGYKTFGYHVNPETGEIDPERYFYLRMQKLDKDGNMIFPEGGVLISYKPTLTASYSSLTMDTLSNGDVVFCFEDRRPGDQTYISNKDLRAYAYCYTQDGQSVWSKDGIQMPVFPQQKNATSRLFENEKITVSGDYIYFTSIVIENVPSTVDNSSVDIKYLEVACMDYNGNILSSRIDSVAHWFNYDIRPAPDGNLYYVYTNTKESYSAECLNPNCENIWSEPTVIDTISVVSRSGGGSEHALPPKEIVRMSDDGLALVYHVYPDQGRAILIYNRLYADGTMFGHRTILTDTIGSHHSHIFQMEDDVLTVFEDRVRSINGKRDEHYLYYNRVKMSDGTKLLDEPNGYILDMNVNSNMDFIGFVKTGDSFQLLTNTNDLYYGTNFNYSTTYDMNGSRQFRKPIYGGDQYISNIEFINEGQYAYAMLTKEEYGKGGIWISRIDLTDYTNSAPVTGELPGKFTVNADGKQVVFAQGEFEYMRSHQFAHISDKQWEALTGKNQWISDPTNINWLDLFGWGTGDDADLTKYSTNTADYATFTDWGNMSFRNLNPTSNPWRTLTADEWDYILNGREDAANKRTIGGIIMEPKTNPVGGAILLPDDFVLPAGIQMDMNATSFNTNGYSLNEWYQLEQNGAIYLPLSAYREGTDIYDFEPISGIGYGGYYWTSTTDGDANAKYVKVDTNGWSIASDTRDKGFAIRLVKDAGDAPTGVRNVEAPAKDNTIRKVLINGKFYIMQGDNLFNAQGARLR